MSIVTVQGAHHAIVSLTYDREATTQLARQIAGAIDAGLADNTIVPFDNASGSPPTVPAGQVGEFVQSQSGTTLLPARYDYVVDSAKSAVIFGNGDANEQILAGAGKLSFFASGGAGSIVTGGGDDLISIAASDPGAWRIAVGNGNDTIRAMGSGNDTIDAGSGKSFIQLGSGSTLLTTDGADTVLAGSGRETITALGSSVGGVVFGNASKLFYLAGGPSTVVGGTGSDTVYGGSGRDLLVGGTGGNNFLQAGSGPATLFGGGNGDQLYAAGDKAQILTAASGNETLSGFAASGHDTFVGGSGADQIMGGLGKNTFVAGTGTATVTAVAGTSNLFEFINSAGGGAETVVGLTGASQVHIELSGFGRDEVRKALAGQKVTDGSVTITLSDHSTVTFQNIGSLTSANFVDSTSGSAGGWSGGSGHAGWGHHT
jgi:Ca2+-binding RTX toxin-like protein